MERSGWPPGTERCRGIEQYRYDAIVDRWMDMTVFSRRRSHGQDGYVVGVGKALLSIYGEKETVFNG